MRECTCTISVLATRLECGSYYSAIAIRFLPLPKSRVPHLTVCLVQFVVASSFAVSFEVAMVAELEGTLFVTFIIDSFIYIA